MYKDGSLADVDTGVYNHHVAFADSKKSPILLTTCPGALPRASLPLSVFAGVAEDKGSYTYATKDGQLDSGYYIGKGDGVFLTAEFVNYTNDTKAVYALVDMEYIPGRANLDVTLESLSVTQCDGTGLGIRPNTGQKKFGATGKEMAIQYDGYLFGIRKFLARRVRNRSNPWSRRSLARWRSQRARENQW